MYGYVFNAIKLGFYSDFEKRSWYIICTSAKVPEDYDDYIDYEDQLFLELAVGKTYLLTLKMVLVEHNQYSRDMVDIHNMYNMYMEQHKKSCVSLRQLHHAVLKYILEYMSSLIGVIFDPK